MANLPHFQDGDLVMLNLEHPDVVAAITEEGLQVPEASRQLPKFAFARASDCVKHPKTDEWWCCFEALYSEEKCWMREDWFYLAAQQDPNELISNTVSSVANSMVATSQISVAGKPFNLKLVPSSANDPQKPLDLSEPIQIQWRPR